MAAVKLASITLSTLPVSRVQIDVCVSVCVCVFMWWMEAEDFSCQTW